MAKYLLIESRDPFAANDVGHFFELAGGLVKDGNEVTLFLVQNGVFPARKSTKSQLLTELSEAGVEILADEFSLRERGITNDRMTTGVSSAKLDVVVDQLADGCKTLWH